MALSREMNKALVAAQKAYGKLSDEQRVQELRKTTQSLVEAVGSVNPENLDSSRKALNDLRAYGLDVVFMCNQLLGYGDFTGLNPFNDPILGVPPK
jgi:hypothetical protein